MSGRCDACGRHVAGLHRCGPCGAALCLSCLGGADRCPSCQRPFAETRGMPSVRPGVFALAAARQRAWTRRVVTLSLLGALVVASLYGALECASR